MQNDLKPPALKPLPDAKISLQPVGSKHFYAGLFLGVFLATLVLLFVLKSPAKPSSLAQSPTHETKTKPPAPEPKPIAVSVPSTVSRRTFNFGQSIAFVSALVANGINKNDADAITKSFEGLVDFTHCRPQDEMVLESNATGEHVLFEYHPSKTQYHVSTKTNGQWVGESRKVPTQMVKRTYGGRIQISLGAALQGLGVPSLAGKFIEAFGSVADFQTKARKGDTFKIIIDEEQLNGAFLRYGKVWAIEYYGENTGTLRAFHYDRGRSTVAHDSGELYMENGRAVSGGWIRIPLNFDHISSPFNPKRFHPVLRRVVPHQGIDFAAGTGTPIWAAADGVVIFVGPKGPNGNLVSIKHDSGFETHYAHLSRFASGMKAGRKVRQKEVIGYVGSTGRSTGPHLHFGLKRRGTFINPMIEINQPGKPLPSGEMAEFKRNVKRLTDELSQVEIVVPTTEPTLSEETFHEE